MRLLPAELVLLPALAFAAPGQSWLDNRPPLEEGAGQAYCDSLQEVQVPKADMPSPEQAGKLGPQCDSIALYQGIGQAPDYRKARLCAYVERKRTDGLEDPFAGDGVLMMIYANGKGVPANLPLARQFACHVFGAPMELEFRQQHLAAIADGKAPHDIDICDDITSGMMMGWCSGQTSRSTEFERGQRLDRLSVSWDAATREAFGRLRKAMAAFADSSSYREQDMSGSAHGMFAVERKEAIADEFEKQAIGFVAGKFPTGKGDAKADAELNAAYRRALGEYAKSEPLQSITPEGLRETQRLWLRYRDAWIAFSHALKPGVDTEPLLRRLTTLRTRQIKAIGTEQLY